MLAYISCMDSISAVVDELGISSEQVPQLSGEEKDLLAEFVHVLAEVRRVARQLEADKKVTMSRAPRLIHELCETLLTMAGEMAPYTSNEVQSETLDLMKDQAEEDYSFSQALPTRHSNATADKERDEARSFELRKLQAKTLSKRLANRIENRLGVLWKPISEATALWRPTDNSSEDDVEDDLEPDLFVPNHKMHEPRRALLFHIAAMLDVNECALDFLEGDTGRDDYYQVLYKAIVREVVELNGSLSSNEEQLLLVFKLFHQGMLETLLQNGRSEPGEALTFWRQANSQGAMISPVPFNLLARAALSPQASSAPAERLFSDLGRLEGRQCQSKLSTTLEMMETIRVYVRNELQSIRLPQSGL